MQVTTVTQVPSTIVVQINPSESFLYSQERLIQERNSLSYM